jgi:hypothetical protein
MDQEMNSQQRIFFFFSGFSHNSFFYLWGKMNLFELIRAFICFLFGFLLGDFCDNNDNGGPDDPDEPPTNCPVAEGTQTLFTLTAPTTSVSLAKSTGLCTLSALAGDGTYIPIGRSYDFNDWELSGSSFAIQQVKSWTCSGGSSSCTVVLPGPYTYVLQRRATSTVIDPSAAAVRFLERASFGATPLQARTTLDYASYIRDQVRVAPTYHRQFFRQRMNPRWDYHQPEFASVESPCGTANTYWRRHILSIKDRRKLIRANLINGSFWSLTVDGHLRTVKQNLRFTRSDLALMDNKDHEFCSLQDEIRRGDFEVRVTTGQCADVRADDWVVAFETGARPPQVLSQDLPVFGNGTGSAWRAISNQVPQFMLTTTLAESACAGLSAAAIGAVNGPPIFARTSDGVWLIYEPRVVLAENTIDNPIVDGGLSALAEGRTKYCSNAPRTFLNEARCRYAARACNSQNMVVTAGAVVCGSRGEIANDPALGDSWLDIASIADDVRARELNLPRDSTPIEDFVRQREFVWSQITLTASDQLVCPLYFFVFRR